MRSGRYASASEVLRAALRALDREETAIDNWLRRQIDESLADPRPSIPAAEVFKELREHHAGRVRKERDKAV